MSTATHTLEALRRSRVCVVCGAPVVHRVLPVVADDAGTGDGPVPLLPLCEPHAAAQNRALLTGRVVALLLLLLPVALAIAAARLALVQPRVAVLAALGGGLLALAGRRALARWGERAMPVRVQARSGAYVTLGIAHADPPETLPAGTEEAGTPRSAAIDPTSPGAIGLLLVTVLAAVIGSWQADLVHPTLWLHNPTEVAATIHVGDEAVELAPGALETVHLTVGRHPARIERPGARQEMPVELGIGADALLGVTQTCVEIGGREVTGQWMWVERGATPTPCE